MVQQHYRGNVRLIALMAGGLCALAAITHDNARALPAMQAQQGIARPLTAQPGDPRRGELIAVDSNKGNCVSCHKMPVDRIPAEAFGDLGPALDGVGARLSAAQLRLRIIDARRINPDTIMPPYHAVAGLNRVALRYLGQSILSAQDVEDLVAYLASLR